MTLREKVAEIEPKAINNLSSGGVIGCPFHYSFLNITDGRTGIFAFCPFTSGVACVSCWNREFVDKDNQRKEGRSDE